MIKLLGGGGAAICIHFTSVDHNTVFYSTEPQLVAAIGNWAKYMLLIGDHYQLKPSVESYALRRDYHLDLSLMERLINNGVQFTTLCLQNRQRPEFAELLRDIYPDLQVSRE